MLALHALCCAQHASCISSEFELAAHVGTWEGTVRHLGGASVVDDAWGADADDGWLADVVAAKLSGDRIAEQHLLQAQAGCVGLPHPPTQVIHPQYGIL